MDEPIRRLERRVAQQNRRIGSPIGPTAPNARLLKG